MQRTSTLILFDIGYFLVAGFVGYHFIRLVSVLQVTKESGEIEEFSEQKLRHSLQQVGASEALIDHSLKLIRKKLGQNLSSKRIYREAFNILRKEARHLAARYSLKKAIMQLGPGGFAFEKLIAEILSLQGYQATTNHKLQGKCVSHEIDVMAEKEGRRVFVECKFRNRATAKVDVKTALYINARALDLQKNKEGLEFNEFWLVTNNRFTSDAIKYARCEGLKLLGWNHPETKSLQDLIYMGQVHPVTCLTSLTKHHKKSLLDAGILLCRRLIENEEAISNLHLRKSQYKNLINEIENLLQYPF